MNYRIILTIKFDNLRKFIRLHPLLCNRELWSSWKDGYWNSSTVRRHCFLFLKNVSPCSTKMARTAITVVLVCGFGYQFSVSGTSFFCNASCIFVMHPFFRNVPTHYKKMSILFGVMHKKVLHFFVVHQRIMKNALQKYVAHSINHM